MTGYIAEYESVRSKTLMPQAREAYELNANLVFSRNVSQPRSTAGVPMKKQSPYACVSKTTLLKVVLSTLGVPHVIRVRCMHSSGFSHNLAMSQVIQGFCEAMNLTTRAMPRGWIKLKTRAIWRYT